LVSGKASIGWRGPRKHDLKASMLFPPKPCPSTRPRVVVTGAGIVTSLGQGWKQNAAAFRAGKTGFRPVTHFDVSRQRVKTAAVVDLPAVLPATKLTERQKKRLDRASIMLLLAAHEASQQAGWTDCDHLPVVLGTTAGGITTGEDYFRQAVNLPHRHKGQPTRVLHYQSHIQARAVLDAIGFAGPITIISNACASGTSAIGESWEMIRRGQADRVLTGGYDVLSQMVFSGFDSLQTLSPTRCRPFDANRDGLALGEGAAVLTIETLESALKRGAGILGEIIGYGASMDRHHLTQPHPEGMAAYQAMQLACTSAQIAAEDVDYINAHGTGTPLNDEAEAKAISRWAGNHARDLPVSSTKAGIGHLLGGAGSVEAVVCLMCLREQWLPPELAFETLDPACAFRIVAKPEDASVNVALSNSFGFGGVNASLIMRRWS
jgi:3-oxoacyl-[acyl-carrier-protein] synthase II